MSSIASAFSNFAKMPAQNDEILDVNEVVDSALDIFVEEGITFEPDENIIEINFDRTQLIRVLTNLVKNAFQSIPNDRNPLVHVNVNSDTDSVYIYVKDNGSGIDVESKERIFEPNFTTKSSGMGLGLAMVKSIVETYSGSIDFTSEIDVGTEFKVRIPLYK